MLKNHFVPVAIDQWHQRTQQDVEGDFYRKIAGQGPRKDFDHTTQGRYVCTPSGTLLAYNNNRGPEKIRAMMHKALEEFDPEAEGNVAPLSSRESAHVRDARHDVRPPESGFILRVHSKVLGGYGPVADREAWMLVFQSAVGRDNAWFTAEEQSKLAAIIRTGGEIPPPLSLRLARFHLIDNTRGEPPRWRTDEIKSLQMSIDGDGRISGTAYLETSNAKRGYECRLLGEAEANGNQVTRFDLVAKGEFWGGGRYTQHAPDGRFPLAVAFRIADGSDPADQIPPHGTKGWVEGYYE